MDDGSTDQTAAEVERWVTRLGSDAIRLLQLKENQGKGAAVRKVLMGPLSWEVLRVLSSWMSREVAACSLGIGTV